jgi:general stress protein YciG
MAVKQNMYADKQPPANRKRGFAGMDQERQREIASQGGKAAHQAGTAHQFTSAEAKEAGAKGRQSAREKKSS